MLLNRTPPRSLLETHQTVGSRNGQIAIRRYTVCHEADWMTSDRRYPGEPQFPGQAMIGNAEAEVERGGTVVYETRYCLCSTRLTAEMFGRVVRGRWNIENNPHWLMDVVFREDLARLRSDSAPAHMAIVRHSAMNLLSRAGPATSFESRRTKAGWDVDYLERVIRGAASALKRFP